MLSEASKIVEGLNLAVEDKNKVLEIIIKQLKVHIACNKPISNVTLYIVGKRVEGVDCIKMFDSNTVVLETLDTSYTRMRNLVTLEDWNTKFVFKVTFKNNSIQITECTLQGIVPAVYKKAKTLTYGVTDGENVVKVGVTQQDIKGLPYETVRDIVDYSFYHKLKGKKSVKNKPLNYMVVEYA